MLNHLRQSLALTYIIISHDSYQLDQLCNRKLEVAT